MIFKQLYTIYNLCDCFLKQSRTTRQRSMLNKIKNMNEGNVVRSSTVGLYILLLCQVFFLLGECQSGNTGDNSNQNILPEMPFLETTFDQFKSTFNKRYQSKYEERYREFIFLENLDNLNHHHLDPHRTFNMKINAFFDLAQDQFSKSYSNTYKSNKKVRQFVQNITKTKNRKKNSRNQTWSYQKYEGFNLKEHNKNRANRIKQKYLQFQQSKFDQNVQNKSAENNNSSFWKRRLQQTRSLGLASSNWTLNSSSALRVGSTFALPIDINIDWTMYSGNVRYQGICGACYAFASLDAISALNAINVYGFFLPLSIQQIIDCSTNGLTYGCDGGFLEGAFTYIQINGVSTEFSYPLTSSKTGKAGKCQSAGGPFKISSFNPIKEGDCLSVIQELQKNPLAIGIAGYNLQFYSEGVFNGCSNTLDHAVLLVGYKSGVGWKIKNSWGADWGIEGYGWIKQGNNCGICNMVVAMNL